jgi:hypothetical protein
LVLIGLVKDVKQKPEKGHHVKDQPNYQLVGVDFTEVQAQDHVHRPALLASQLQKLNMVAIQKSKKQKLKPEPKLDEKFGKNLKK